jgi:hypothetical protein
MKLLFATLARAAVAHERDEITIVRAFRRIVLPRHPEGSALPELVIAIEVEAGTLDAETEQLCLDLIDEDGRFAGRLIQVPLRLPASTEGIRARRYHFILIRDGRITFPSSMVLPQQMTFRLRLGARDVAALNLLLT